MKSVTAVGLGVLVALAIGLLVVFGILAPVFTRFSGLELAGSTALPITLMVFADAFSFYFGGKVSGTGDHGGYPAGSRLPRCLLRGLLRRCASRRGALRLQPEISPSPTLG